MGRMLEVLRHRDETRATVTDTKEPPGVRPEIVTEWSLREDDVPFIEVGPNRSMEASPLVLAPSRSPRREPASPVQPPHAPTEHALADRGISGPASPSLFTAQVIEPRPISVQFEPFSGFEVGKIAQEVIAFHQPNHPISQQYSALIEKLLASESGQTLLLSGVRSGVGTSTVLLNLAVAAAQKANKKVTIVETQRQRPGLAGKLGLRPLAFLQDVLRGAVGLEQALMKSPLPRLAILAATAARPEIALGVEAISWLLRILKERNDLVLVDGPSVDEKDDLSVMAPLADGMFLVSPQGEPATTGRPILQLVARLGGRLRGLLHTQLAS